MPPVVAAAACRHCRSHWPSQRLACRCTCTPQPAPAIRARGVVTPLSLRGGRVFSAECIPAFDWQSVGLFYSFYHSKQPGRITRLLACEDEQLRVRGSRSLTMPAPTMRLRCTAEPALALSLRKILSLH